MFLKNKTKIFISCIVISITIVITSRYIYNSRPNACEVYMNGKFIVCVKDEKEFFDAQDSIKKDIEKRFGKIKFKDNIKFVKKHINEKELYQSKRIKKSILENSNAKVNAIFMKSDGKKVAILANEDEMKKVIDTIKNSYKEKEKSEELKLINHITYIKQDINIGEVNTVDQAITTVKENSKNPIIAFSKTSDIKNTNSIDKANPSRGSSTVNFMSIPSKGNITSPFGSRWGTIHNGIDIGAPMGTPIYAAMDGQVSCSEWEDGYGNVIKVRHSGEVETIYAHCSSINSKVGEYVKRGEKIGEVGSTGRSTGPHVHFEIRIAGHPENPLKYLK